MQRDFDYVVVGGGTAGCCLAARLSEDPESSVLLIERGGVGDTWSSRVPLISANFFRDDAPSKILTTEPCASLADRAPTIVVGNGLGGASRVNGCVYTRGPREHHAWEKAGRVGWDYRTMEPYFIKSERALGREMSDCRGSDGTWVNQCFRESCFKVVDSALESAKQVGLPFVDDLSSSGAPLSGCGSVDLTIDEHKHRMSSFEAFLPASIVGRRKNLVVCVGTVVTRVMFADKASDRPIVDRIVLDDVANPSDAASFVVKVKKEVILCAGAVYSPQILMLR